MPEDSNSELNENVIDIIEVSRQYLNGTFTAVDNVSIEIPKGEVVAFVGPSGCGKTTVMRMVAGLEPANSGKIIVNGNPVNGPGPDRGMIFQAYTSFPWLTAIKNVEYGMKILGVPAKQRRERALKLLEEFHLGDAANKFPNELSGGMKQRVAIARTLAQDPHVLLMDEPFGALDAQVRWEMQEMMIEIFKSQNKTVILVTHDIQEAIYLADRIIFYTKSPGKVKHDLTMSFKDGKRFSKKEELLGLPGYADTEKKLFAWMREEIQK